MYADSTKQNQVWIWQQLDLTKVLCVLKMSMLLYVLMFSSPQTNLLVTRQHTAHTTLASEYLLMLVCHLWPDH